MKKVLLAGLLCLVMLVTLTGCGDKTVQTAGGFSQLAQEQGCTVADATEQFASEEVVQSVTLAQHADGWQVEFYVLTDADAAGNMFDYNKSTFESSKGSSSTESSANLGNYSSYSLTTDGTYKYLCRVDNTVVYVDVDSTYKDAVKDLIKAMGY